jgi:DNA-binding CsgD family transcriptional regulator
MPTYPKIHRYLYELAFNYYYLNDDAKVIALLTEAAQYPPFNPNLHIQTFNTLAMAYTRQQPQTPATIKLAEANYQQAYRLAATYRDSVWLGIVRGNLGGLYAYQGRWQEALAALRTDYRLEMRSAAQRGFPKMTAVKLARAFYELNQLDSCRYYLGEAQRLCRLNSTTADFGERFQDEAFWELYYALARRYYQRTGDVAEADRCADSLLVYQTRIGKRVRSRDAALAEQRLLLQQHEAEVADLERRSRTQWLLLGAGGVLAVLLGGLYWSSQRRRRQEARANAEREQRMAAELERAKADLAGFMEALRQKETPPDPALLDTHLLTHDDWDEFRRRFERVHPAFFEQLHRQFADLTPAEERLLALSKLRLDTRHMSRMLGISAESIRKSKYRLRKKLGVSGSTSLLELLE